MIKPENMMKYDQAKTQQVKCASTPPRVGSSRKLIRAVSVVCLLCSACLSVNNISWAQTQHNAACVGRHASTSAAPPPPSSAQSPAMLVEAKQEFSLFLYTSGTPFARADNPHLKRMFQLLGMPDSPTAKQVRTSYLSSTYSRLKKRVEVVVEQLLLGLSLMLCTDGWRHRRAGKGQPLVNCVLLKAMGGAIFHHVCQLDKGDKKDAMFYVNLHNSMADKASGTHGKEGKRITKKRPHLLLGVIMDSPTTNRAALKILAEQHPTWICITCIVHALNLLCKDLANNSRRSEKHTEVGRVLKEVQQIAKTLGDCHKISSALDTAQLEVYGELRGVSAHIDTRFAILVLDPINFLPTRHGVQPLPPWKDLTAEQQQDVKLVVARLAQVAPDAAAEELDNFEMGAWDPDMTRVANIILRMTKATEIDGRTVTVIAPAHQRLTWWQVYAQSKFPILAKAAMRLLSVHVSTCAAERNWSAWGRTFADAHRNTLSIEKAEELVFIQANDELTNSNQRDQEKELAIELY
ncbi:hypothetical protein QJQ45_029985 [Haematococcus lacustris]|nr:hypothetical protein QJQ45_029985 [Haematococcus lacustris]